MTKRCDFLSICRKPLKQSGFTLIELLVAMSLTVLIGSVSYQFLNSALDASEQGAEVLDDLTAVERLWSLLASDLTHTVARPAPLPAVGLDALSLAPQTVLQGATKQRPAMISYSGAGMPLTAIVQRPGAVLWFTRQGWENPLQQSRSQLQRVVYRFEDGRVYRDYSAERNQRLDEMPAGSLMLMDGVEDFSLQFLARGMTPVAGAWRPQWPAHDGQVSMDGVAKPQLPAAIEVTMTSRQLGVLKRIFLLPGV